MAFSIKAADAPAEPGLSQRYQAGYQTANLLRTAGRILMYWICWIYALLVLYERTHPQIARAPPFFFVALLPSIFYQALYIWILGLMMRALGYIVVGVLDTAANTSASPANE